jgi:hypothetical protein
MSQLWPLTVTVAANTPIDTPTIVPWPLADANLDFIDIIVPDGHSGQTGVAVFWSGTQIVPWGNDTWIVANDEKIHVPVNSYITISGLSVYAYNLGQFEHSFYLRAHVTYTTSPVVTQEGSIGTSEVLGTAGSIYDESLTPDGLTGTADVVTSNEQFEPTGGETGSLTELPESVS